MSNASSTKLDSFIQANGHRVMTIAPRYDQYKDAWDTDVVIEVYQFYLDFFSFFSLVL